MLFKHISSKLEGEESNKLDNFCLVEKWRKIERPLGPGSKVLRVWLAWGQDNTEVKLVVKRNVSATQSGPALEPARVRRKRSKMVKKADTVHPRYVPDCSVIINQRVESFIISRTLMEEKEKCKDSIQKLMKIIITQGNPEIISILSASAYLALSCRKYNSDPAGGFEGEGGGH